MRVAFVHGKKLLNNGNLHPEFIFRLQKAQELLVKQKVDKIIISGGQTRPHFISESKKGYEYLRERGVSASKLEKMGGVYSTYDEVVKLREFTKKIDKIEKIYVVSSWVPMLRVRLYYKKFWRLPIELEFVGSKTSDYFYYLLAEPIALVFAILYFPRLGYMQKILSWFKMEFRNARTS